ncbi:MAG: hypothetical protein NC209_02820 [Alistipes sp.]|nr:hypothetical protein [Alistipes senegalensis]MCM1250061.1 hypothetical protein [Alistipes sp.]
MYSVSSELYRQVAAQLTEAIGARGYFSGSIEGETSDAEWRLTVSAIVYREHVSAPDGEYDAISDLVPVWWEFHTFAPDGETLNDFSFSELRTFV